MISPATRNRIVWRGLLVVLALALLVLVIGQFTSLQTLGNALASVDPRWVAVAAVMQAAFFVGYAGLYQAGFRSVDVGSSIVGLVPVVLASLFVKTALPITAVPAVAVFIDDAASRGQSGSRAAVGLVVVLVMDLVTALPFVAAGAIALVLRARLVAFAVVGTGLFVAFIVTLLACLLLAARRPGWLAALLRLLATVINRLWGLLRRPALVADDWARRTTDQLVTAVTSIPNHPRDIVVAGGWGLLLHVANLAGLAALFLAFGQRLDPVALIAGFGMSIVFFVIAIVPDGIGAVEGAMALTFVQLGMDAASAILVTLAYRLLNIWLPAAIGFWCARRLRIFGANVVGPIKPAVIGPEPAVIGPEAADVVSGPGPS